MDLELEGSRALVCGGSAGLGRACAESLGQAGARLALAARAGERLSEAARRLAVREGQADERLLAVARQRGQSPDALALSAALAQPWADVVLSGAATVEALHSNLSALRAPSYDQETDRRLLPLREEREHYWSERANLLWT